MDQARGRGMVVICYADTSVSGGVRSLWREHLDREVQEAECALPHDPHARRDLQRHVQAIRALLSSQAARRSRSVAAFASLQQGLTRAFTFGTPLVDRLVVDEEPYVLPLLELLHRERPYLMVHTDTHHGRLYHAWGRHTGLIAEIEENVPRRHRAAGERWGKQQATIARHREDHLLRYRKALVQEIERAWPAAPFAGLVLLGEHEVLEHVRKDLPAHLIHHVVYEGPHAWVGKQPRLDTRLQAIVEDAMRAHDQRLAGEVRGRVQEHHGVATGPQEVIDALRNGQVGYPGYVVMEPDRGEMARRCTGCRSIFAHAHELCPYCQVPCEKANLWQAIALLATRHGVTVHFVGPEAGLGEQGGIVAVLARDEPWMPAEGPPAGGSGAVA